MIRSVSRPQFTIRSRFMSRDWERCQIGTLIVEDRSGNAGDFHQRFELLMDQFRIRARHRFDEQRLQMLPRQARSRRRQIGLANAQHDQALLDPNLHSVVGEPDAIVAPWLGLRELGACLGNRPWLFVVATFSG